MVITGTKTAQLVTSLAYLSFFDKSFHFCFQSKYSGGRGGASVHNSGPDNDREIKRYFAILYHIVLS